MKLLGLICFLLLAQPGSSQELLTMSNDHKYIYYEVVKDTSAVKDKLMQKAETFLKKSDDQKLKITSIDNDKLAAEGKIIIDKTILVASHPSGEVAFKFYFNAKDGRYRFWLDDFIYTPYIRDRYGSFVPKTNFGKPLESHPSNLKAAEWKGILAATFIKAKQLGEELKKFMAAKRSTSSASVPPKVVIKSDW
ncbi:hypothetical protein ACVWYG_003060 [Pedobacter sp. UYEF25]